MTFPNRRQFLHLAAGSAVLPIVPGIARAQAYPTKPIRLVVPFPPGGAFDFVGRPWADRMKPLVGTVVIENIGGGGSSPRGPAAVRGRPRGYTLPLGRAQTHVNETLLQSRPPHDAGQELGPVSRVA